MTPTVIGILHAGPLVEPTFSDYLARALLHLVAFGGLALLVHGWFAAARAARAAFTADS